MRRSLLRSLRFGGPGGSGGSEPTEHFFLNLSNFTGGGSITKAQGICTIQQNPIIPAVTLSRTSGKGPLAVGFDATGTVSGYTTNPGHDLYYSWDFGDPAGETWEHGATVGLDKNLAYGPIAGHVYKTPGTFTWNLLVMDGRGNIETITGSVTVNAWAAADTIYIANGTLPVAGGDVLAGATYYNETTWAGVVSRWAVGKRIMLRRGDTWACAATTYVPSGCEINAYGTGANPEVSSAGAGQTPFTLADTDDSRVCNVKHAGPGPGYLTSGMVNPVNTYCTNTLLLGLESDGSTFGLITASVTVENIFLQDCYFHRYNPAVTSSTQIAVYVTHGYGVYLLGSWFDQTSSHCVRISGAQNLVIDSCKMSRPAQSTGSAGNALTIREIGNNTGTWQGEFTEKVIVSNCVVDSSTSLLTSWCFHIGVTNTTFAGRLRNILIERNHVISDRQCLALYAEDGLTVRNNILRSTDWEVVAGIANSNEATPDRSPDVVNTQFYNNTVYSTRVGTFAAFQLGTTINAIADTVIRNNLVYAPLATAPTLTIINTGVSGSVIDHNSSDAQILSTRPWATVTPTVPADYTPTGYALGSGVFDYRSQKDFFNAAITAPVDMGAIQV